MLRIIEDHGKLKTSIYFEDLIGVEFDTVDFIRLTIIHVLEKVSMMELIMCYQEQFMKEVSDGK